MTVLVTGGAGFVGTNLINKLIEMGYDVISIDDYSMGMESNHNPKATYINGHTSDIDSLANDYNISVVFHLGEHSVVPTSFELVDKVWKSNVEGTFRVVEYCRRNNIKLIYAGSSTKFASEGIGQSPYAFMKAKNTELIKHYSDWFGLNYGICYFYNVFGRSDTIPDKNGYESVVRVFEKQQAAGLPITICGTGEQIRSFTYIDDIVDGLIRVWNYEKNIEIQLNNSNKISILELAKMFSDNIEFIPARPGDRSDSVTTNNDAREILGWDTTMDITEWIEK